MQGFTVKNDGDTCKIFPMFSSPINNTVNEITGLSKEDELGLKEKQKVIRLNDVNEKYKEEYLNSYFEDLHVSSDETDWSVMIIRALEFNDFKDCVNLLNMLEDGKFVFHYKYELEKKFDEMVSWFVITFLGITTRPMPPVMTENRKVDLLSLYMIVERDGGYNSVTEDNLWPIIARDMGFEYKDGEYMRTVYAMYLDILVYYYKFKDVQTRANNSERMKGREDVPECSLGRSTSAEEIKEVTGMESYALYAENSWEGAWNAHKKRRKFNFDHARKAVEEANASVLKGVTKPKEAIIRANGSDGEPKGLIALFDEVLSQAHPKDGLVKMIDPRLKDNYPLYSVHKMAQLAKACTHEDPQRRPRMRSIVVALMNLSSSMED
ncbi:putative non-specific serine/threonine protein kinase [Helianthus annuus]|nr:putative non-specific serine/threonine protein kinase [Helianthus annuus]